MPGVRYERGGIFDADSMAFIPAQGIIATTIQTAIEEAVKKLTIPIKEENTSALTKGQVVCATGASGEKVKVGLCDCTDPDKIRIMGLVSTDLVKNAAGFSIFKGELPGVDTRPYTLPDVNPVNPIGETWAEGAMLWVADIDGGMTHTRPTHGRSIKAAISRKGSHASDILEVISHENPIHMRAAAGEDIVLGMGDSAGANEVSYLNYAGVKVAALDSNGNAAFTGLKASTDPVDEHGVGDRGFNDGRYLPKILDIVIASSTGNVAVTTMGGGIEKITGAYTRTLPAAVVGMQGLFRASTAAAFSLKAGASDHFEMFDGTIISNGDKQTSGGTKNEFIQVYCEVANTWITIGQSGAFADGGA